MKQAIHTAWCHYAATGEGSTLFAYITWAVDEDDLRRKLREDADEFWASTAEVTAGVARNDVTERLWPAATLDLLEQCAREHALITARAEVHINMS